MWAHLEQAFPGFQRRDPDTWDRWPAKGFGMAHKLPVFSAPALNIRQHPRVYECFQAVLLGGECQGVAEAEPEDVCCSHDRWWQPLLEAGTFIACLPEPSHHTPDCLSPAARAGRVLSLARCRIFYRKTKAVGSASMERSDWRTKRNVHLDMNPWEASRAC